MSPTLRPRDRVLVNKLAYGAAVPWTDWRVCYRRPHRGAVITFYPPFVSHRTFMRPQFVKRIIGMPGDTLEMRAGRLYVNQRSMIEPYAVHGGTPDTSFVTMTWQRGYLARQVPPASYRPTRDHWGPLLVPASQYFVLGDHRDESADSRYWGFVPAHVITGTPVWVWRPAH